MCEIKNPDCLIPGTDLYNKIKDFDYGPGGYRKEGAENAAWPVEECPPQAVWRIDNMWSPRRGHKAVVAKAWPEGDKLYVMGGRAREYAKFEDERMVGGRLGPRVETEIDRITTREENVLKNDIWVSEDGLGVNWELVNAGCKEHQEDIQLKSEEVRVCESRRHVEFYGVRE